MITGQWKGFAVSIPVAALVTLVSLGAACAPADGRAADTPTAGPTTKPPYTLDQFKGLRWLLGDWRGRTPEGATFYESYRSVNDSTMEFVTYTDSTFAKRSATAFVALRAGAIIDQGDSAPWTATHLDPTGIAFTPPDGSGRQITWLKGSPTTWNAIITTMHDGHEQRVTLPMEQTTRRK